MDTLCCPTWISSTFSTTILKERFDAGKTRPINHRDANPVRYSGAQGPLMLPDLSSSNSTPSIGVVSAKMPNLNDGAAHTHKQTDISSLYT